MIRLNYRAGDDPMFYLVCASTERSSVRVGCQDLKAAQLKVAELEDTKIGKVRVFDDAGNRISLDELHAPGETPEPTAEANA